MYKQKRQKNATRQVSPSSHHKRPQTRSSVTTASLSSFASTPRGIHRHHGVSYTAEAHRRQVITSTPSNSRHHTPEVQTRRRLSTSTSPNHVKREDVEDLLVRKFFIAPSYEIYGGVAGLYDYGPPGSAIMANLQAHWRKHFVLTEQMLEIACSTLTPEPVLKASGHADRFTDFMVQDTKTQEYYRADKLLEEHLEKLIAKDKSKNPQYLEQLESDLNAAGSMSQPDLDQTLQKYNVTVNGNPISNTTQFNLMFKTSIGPTGKVGAFLRPETAQGIFVNFRRLYEFNNRRLPFAGAQIGLAYRNEIAPRGGLLRVREFPMAEIEHFVHPDRKQHPKFPSIAHLEAQFWTAESQQENLPPKQATFETMVGQGMVSNQTLGYFLGRTLQFLTDVGIDQSRVRFRQHRDTEMAHYAQDCWDAEILTSYGWVECVGHADRSAYDLKVHSDATRHDLTASEPLEQPITRQRLTPQINRAVLGKRLRGQAAAVFAHLETISQEQLSVYHKSLADNGSCRIHLSEQESVDVLSNELSIDLIEEKISVDSFVPHVIEPSFGLGRIVYSLLEHAYYVRPGDDEQRKVLRLQPLIAPFKVGIYNVVSNIPYHEHLERLKAQAIDLGLAYAEDVSKTSIGRKYSRGDEIGTPFAVSIDSDTITHQRVTIRERDSMQQIQVRIDDAMDVVHQLCRGKVSWSSLLEQYPLFTPGTSSSGPATAAGM